MKLKLIVNDSKESLSSLLWNLDGTFIVEYRTYWTIFSVGKVSTPPPPPYQKHLNKIMILVRPLYFHPIHVYVHFNNYYQSRLYCWRLQAKGPGGWLEPVLESGTERKMGCWAWTLCITSLGNKLVPTDIYSWWPFCTPKKCQEKSTKIGSHISCVARGKPLR